MENSTQYLTKCVRNKIPVSFSKYGDGEYNCAKGDFGYNSDKDKYTSKLRQSLIESFKYMAENAKNSRMGRWHNGNIVNYWNSLTSKPAHWVNYHTIIFDQNNDKYKVELFKAIKESSSKKIIICNSLLVKAQSLLNIDHMVNVPFNNWFDTDLEKIIESVANIINQDPTTQYIIITCCGMGAKVLISKLHQQFPNNIYLDFGSALDIICTKKDSRGWYNFGFTYEYFENQLKDLLPHDWNDAKYDDIYKQANYKLGN